jgi:hypothetical protein
MVGKTSWKAWVVLGVAVALFVTSGGLLVASNMGFKMNKALARGAVTGTNVGVSWVSIPFNNPYGTFRGLCKAFVDQFGYSNALAGAITFDQILVNTVNVNGAARTVNCFTCCGDATCTKNPADVNCNHSLVQDGTVSGGPHATRIRITGTAVTSPQNLILVGSSNEGQKTPGMLAPSVTNTNISHNWITIPYHTTAQKASDICVALGATLPNSAIAIARIDQLGATTQYSCGTSATLANNFSIVIGEGIRITKSTTTFPPALPAGGIVPAHF